MRDTELTQRFEAEKILLIEKFSPDKVISAIYFDNEKQQFNVKRFKIETTSLQTKFLFIKEGDGNRIEAVSTEEEPSLIVQTGRGSQVRRAKFKIAKMVEVMGWKAVGAKLMDYSKSIEMEWEKNRKRATSNRNCLGNLFTGFRAGGIACCVTHLSVQYLAQL